MIGTLDDSLKGRAEINSGILKRGPGKIKFVAIQMDFVLRLFEESGDFNYHRIVERMMAKGLTHAAN